MKEYVRVSDILSSLQSFGHINPEVLEAKAKIGTDVHQAIVDDCAGEFPILETNRAAAYFGSYKMGNFGTKIRQVPRLFCDKLLITGECDGLLNTGEKHETLIDWKCTAGANVKIWTLQAHFYWYLLQQNGYTVGDNMMWVNLKHTKVGDEYKAAKPQTHNILFNESTLFYCIELANKFWEDRNNAKDTE